MEHKGLYDIVAQVVRERTGIHYPESNYYQLESRLVQLQKFLGLEGLGELHQVAQKGFEKEALAFLLDVATNNETSFFRDQKPFNALKEILLTKFADKKDLRIWSAGCSNGQEVYSILMTISEHAPQLLKTALQIMATDISPRVLKKAESGIYSQLEVQRGLPIQMLMKYFTQTEDKSWAVKGPLKTPVKWGEFNLLKGIFSPQAYDIIFCRNVLIYQEVEKKKEILRRFYESLKPGGFLFVGSSENLFSLSEDFQSQRIAESSVYQKPENQVAKAG